MDIRNFSILLFFYSSKTGGRLMESDCYIFVVRNIKLLILRDGMYSRDSVCLFVCLFRFSTKLEHFSILLEILMMMPEEVSLILS